jgi:hypothetical protein
LNDRKFLTSLWPEAALHPAGKAKKMVVCAVGSEPVSRVKFPVRREKTGKFRKIATLASGVSPGKWRI